ncbi:MAG: segregation/condensation protein A [Candidatus Brocadiia bacterium]
MPQEADNGPVAEVNLEDFRAELDVFNGPLDLLLHLIKQEEVDIFEVQVSQITDRYLAAVRTMEFFDVNVAAEFLVVAATLMEMKSRTLLPPDAVDEEEDEEDPGVELIRRLLEYKGFKEAADELDERRKERGARFARPRAEVEQPEDAGPEALLEDLAVWDLMGAFAEVVEQTRLRPSRTRIIRSDVPVSAYVDEILHTLHASGGRLGFTDLFRRERSRERVVGIFLALLELVRRKAIQVEQTGPEARNIRILLRSATPGESESG